MHCQICGKEVLRTGSRQKYCPECAKAVQLWRIKKLQNKNPNPPGICQICGSFCEALATHLKYSHSMTLAEYYRQYPREKKRPVQLWGRQAILG